MQRLFILGDSKETYDVATSASVNLMGLFGVGMEQIKCVPTSYQTTSLAMYYKLLGISDQDEMVIFITKDNYLSFLGCLFMLDEVPQNIELLSRYHFVLCDFSETTFVLPTVMNIVGVDKYAKLYANNTLELNRLIDAVNSNIFKENLGSFMKKMLKNGTVALLLDAIKKIND